MLEQSDPTTKPDDDTCRLPALLPPVSLELRRMESTLAVLSDVVQESSAEYWYERGKAANEVEKYDDAAWCLQECLTRESQHWRAELQLAVASLNRNPDAAATATLRAYSGPYPSWGSLVGELAVATWDKIGAALRSHKDLTSDPFCSFLALAFVYRVVHQPKLARQALEIIQVLYPEKAKLSVGLFRLSGGLWSDENQWQLAVNDYNQVVFISPRYAPVYLNRGRMKQELGNKEEALADYDRAVELGENSAVVYHRRGKIKYSLKNYEDAVSDYNKVIVIDPYYPGVYFDRGLAKDFAGDEIGAIADYDHAASMDPNNSRIYYNRGYIKLFLEEITGALTDFDHAIELDPNYAAYYFHRGNVKSRLDDQAGALRDYDRCIELGIRIAPAKAFFNRARTKAILEDLIGALEDFDEAIKITPLEASYYEARSWIKEDLGDKVGAAIDYQKFKELGGK